MEGNGAGDGVPNMMTGAGSGDDSPTDADNEQNEVMNALYSQDELNNPDQSIHDQM